MPKNRLLTQDLQVAKENGTEELGGAIRVACRPVFAEKENKASSKGHIHTQVSVLKKDIRKAAKKIIRR